MHARAFSCISRGRSAMFQASLPRACNAVRSREKEKPAKFANGSLLGNDSRIFVQYHGSYPLSRMRPPRTPSTSPHSLPFQSSAETPVYFIPSLSTLPFLGHPLVLLPLATTLCTLEFVCILHFPFRHVYHYQVFATTKRVYHANHRVSAHFGPLAFLFFFFF